jgi:hypothetical protein
MVMVPLILPGTGRGTAGTAVEGAVVPALPTRGCAIPMAPSTMLRMVPRPLQGRICP